MSQYQYIHPRDTLLNYDFYYEMGAYSRETDSLTALGYKNEIRIDEKTGDISWRWPSDESVLPYIQDLKHLIAMVVTPARPGTPIIPNRETPGWEKSLPVRDASHPFFNYSTEVVLAIDSMRASKVYSPMYQKTFDQMTDAEIKTQIDHWYDLGKGPELREHVLFGDKYTNPKLRRYLQNEPVNRKQRRSALNSKGYYYRVEYAGERMWNVIKVTKTKETVVEKISNVKPQEEQ